MGPTIFVLLFCAASSYFFLHQSFAVCHSQANIYTVWAYYWTSTKNRLYELDCRFTPGLTTSCTWSNVILETAQGPKIYQCPANHLLSGLNSYRSLISRERHFELYCCYLAGRNTTSCSYSDLAYSFYNFLYYYVSWGYRLKGFKTEYNSSYHDRT